MNKFWIFFKTQVITTFKNPWQLLFVFVVLPILFAGIMGFSFSSAFSPESSSPEIQVSIENQDEGELGAVLVDILASDQFASYLVINEEDAAFDITILPDYSVQMQDTLVEVQASENSSISEENLLVQLLSETQQALIEQFQLNEAIAGMEDPSERSRVQNELAEVAEIPSLAIFEEVNYESDTALTSNQFTSVAGLIYVLLMSLTTSVNLKARDDMKGLRKRMGILPLTPAEDITFNILSDGFIIFLMGTLYMGIWHLIDSETFSGNFLFYLMWLLAYVFLFQVISQFLYYFVPSKYVNLLYQVLVFVYMLLGFMPLEIFFGGEASEIFSENYFRMIFNQPLYDYILTGQWWDNLHVLLLILSVSLLGVAIMITIRNRKELQHA